MVLISEKLQKLKHFVFPSYDILNIVNVIKKMTVKDLMEFIYENCCQRIGLTKAESNKKSLKRFN